MKDKLLYFPYINVPYESWIVRNLLYWDEIGAIVPMDYIHEPGMLQREMRELVSSQLVTQIIPGDYVYRDSNRFAQAFIKLLEDYKVPERSALSNFGVDYSSKIHVEKFGYQITRCCKSSAFSNSCALSREKNPQFEQELSAAALAMSTAGLPQVPLRFTLAGTVVFLQRLVPGKFATDWKTCAN